jgi:hypothetical protein
MAKKKKTYPGWFDSFGGLWTNLHDWALMQGPYNDGRHSPNVPPGYHLVWVGGNEFGIAPDAKKVKPETGGGIHVQPVTGGGPNNHHLIGPPATSDPFHFLK